MIGRASVCPIEQSWILQVFCIASTLQTCPRVSVHLSYYTHVALSANAINKLWRMVLVHGTTFGVSAQVFSYSDILIYWVLPLAPLREDLNFSMWELTFQMISKVPFLKYFFSTSLILKWPDSLKFGHTKIHRLQNSSLMKYSLVLDMEGSDKF